MKTCKICFLLLICAFFTTIVSAANIDAGAICNYTDILCMEKSETSVEMTVENLRVATNPEQYAFLLILVGDNESETVLDTIQINQESAKFQFSPSSYPQIPIPSTFFVKRIVNDGSAWFDSEGKCVFTVSYNEYSEETVTYCINDLPATGVYTYSDGRTETYVFRADTLERVFFDRTELGCVHQHTIRCQLLDVPMVEVEGLGSVCQADSKMEVTYRILKGTPTSCRITFNQVAKDDGFVDVDLDLNEDNLLELPLATSQRKEYEATFRFYDKNSQSGCESNPITQTFTLNLDGFVHEKWNDVLFVDNNDKNCEPDCDSDLRFASYQWYKNGKLLEGETGQVYHEDSGLNGTYFVIMTDTAGNEYRSCEIERHPVINQANASMQISPVPAQPGETISILTSTDGNIFITDIMGRVINTKTVKGGQLQTSAPLTSGVYTVAFISDSGVPDSKKLIVK